MSAFIHEFVARIRATTPASKTLHGRSRCRGVSRDSSALHAAKSRKWVIAGLR